MNIHSSGTVYFDNYRMSGPGSGLTGSVSRNQASGGGADFAEMIKAPQTTGEGGSGPSAGPGKPVIDKNDKLYQACLELETFLVKTLISGMRNTVQKSGLVDEGFAGKMYEDMLYDEYAKDFTKNANFGLAEQAYLQLTGRYGRTADSAF
jgi:flagellar protein FlgJ